MIKPSLGLHRLMSNLRYLVGILSIGLFGLQSFGLPVLAQNIVISEIMVNPVVVSKSNGQWIELHNTSDELQDITNYSVRIDGANYSLETANLVATSSFEMPAKGYFLMCANSETDTNGGLSCNYDWNGFELSEDTSQLALNDDDSEILDQVSYDTDDVIDSDSMVVERDENNQPFFVNDSVNEYNGADSGTPGRENLDTDAPYVQIISPQENTKSRMDINIIGTITDTNLKDYQVTLKDETNQMIYQSAWIDTENDHLENKLLDKIDSTQLFDGNYSLILTARDQNMIEAEDIVNISVDNTAPIVTVKALKTNYSTPSIRGAVDDTDAEVRVYVNGRKYMASNQNGKWSAELSRLPDGIYRVVAIATDTYGNTGQTSLNKGLVIDSTAPKVTVNRVKSFSHSPTLTGTVNDRNSRIYVSVLDKEFKATNHGDGTWSLENVRLTDNGIHGMFDVSARAIDNFGNIGKDLTTDELTITGYIDSLLNKLGSVVYAAGADSGVASELDSDGDGIPDSQDGTPYGENDSKQDQDNESDNTSASSADNSESNLDLGWVLLAGAAIAFLWYLLKAKEEQ